jgi:hypothetical protein
MKGRFKDTKGAIRNHKSMKDRNHNCQEKTDKTTNNDPLQNNTHRKLKIEQHEPHYKPNINPGICFLFFQ